MKMYARFMMMMIMVTMFLLVIFTHIDSHVGTRPISIYDVLTRQEPIELARDAEGESPAYTTQQAIIKTKDKHEGKEKHDKSEKHKIEKSDAKPESAQDSPSGTSRSRQPDGDKPPQDGATNTGTRSHDSDTNKGLLKRSLDNEENQLVLVTHEPEEALKKSAPAALDSKSDDSPLSPPVHSAVSPAEDKMPLQILTSKQSSTTRVKKKDLQTTEAPLVLVETAAGKPIKAAQYPPWWIKGWSKSATAGMSKVFVGDKPLFPPCVLSGNAKRGVRMLATGPMVPSVKNPCWYSDTELKTGMRCVPYFYVAGVPNCGTVEMYRRLRFHPNITFGAMREYHWWDRTRFGEGADDKSPLNGKISFKQYTEMIPGRQGLENILQDLSTHGKSIRVFGDVSPSYFVDVNHWPLLDGNQGCNEPRVVIGQHIRHVFPAAKIIITVRHPTPRLYLRFLFGLPRTRGVKRFTSFMFHKLVTKAVRSYRDCFERWSIRHCAYNVSLYKNDKVRLVEGMYPVFMADWLRVFPRSQILIVRYRDFLRDAAIEMKKIVQFLDLPPLNRTVLATLSQQSRINYKEALLYKEYGPMLPETVDMLNDFYEPFVDKFAEILNDERFLWRDTDHL